MLADRYATDLQLLTNTLRVSTFRFILIGHNHPTIVTEITDFLQQKLRERPLSTIRFYDKDYRSISDELTNLEDTIVVIPDFDWLFRVENTNLRVGFNQRRDALAYQNLAFVCFIQPSSFAKVPTMLPDWFSLRSLELEFEIENDLVENLVFEKFNFLNKKSQTIQIEEEITSLKKQLTSLEQEDDNLKLKLLNQVGLLYQNISKYNHAFDYYQQILQLSKKIKNKKYLGIALNNLGEIYRIQGMPKKALDTFEQSLTLHEEVNNLLGIGTTLNNISQIYHVVDDYEAALHFLNDSLAIHKKINNRVGEGTVLNNIGENYRKLKNYDAALDYFERSLVIQREIKNQEIIGRTLNNISLIYESRGDYEKSLQYLKYSIAIQTEIGDQVGMSVTLHNMALIALRSNNGEQYLEYGYASWEIALETKSVEGIFQIGLNLGTTLCKIEQIEEGLKILYQAKEICQSVNYPRTDEITVIIQKYQTE